MEGIISKLSKSLEKLLQETTESGAVLPKATLAEKLGCSKRTIDRLLDGFKAEGWVSVNQPALVRLSQSGQMSESGQRMSKSGQMSESGQIPMEVVAKLNLPAGMQIRSHKFLGLAVFTTTGAIDGVLTDKLRRIMETPVEALSDDGWEDPKKVEAELMREAGMMPEFEELV